MNILEKSILVAAHPDDENLWFSSILSDVDWIILCFLPVESRTDWTVGRRKSLLEYPLSNISCLELKESEVFWGVDWNCPVKTEYGLKITKKQFSDVVYRKNYNILLDHLRETLRGYLNVFTHNPWGEYGHVEHVQVYCAVKALQKEMGFELWFTNYVSNKSLNLMAIEYPQIGPHIETRKTNKKLASSISEIYKRNNCWTWYDDYQWCNEETLIRNSHTNENKGGGSLMPIKLIDVGVETPVKSRPTFYNWIITRVQQLKK